MEALGYLLLPEPATKIQINTAVSFEDIFEQISKAIQIPKQYYIPIMAKNLPYQRRAF